MTTTSSGNGFDGGLVRYNNGGTITSSYATGDATADATGGEGLAGGLVGYTERHDHVQLCDGSGKCDRKLRPNRRPGGV